MKNIQRNLTKTSYKVGEEKYQQICELIVYLQSVGAKTGEEI
jgi:hypothetical protein